MGAQPEMGKHSSSRRGKMDKATRGPAVRLAKLPKGEEGLELLNEEVVRAGVKGPMKILFPDTQGSST